jgi:hypothetical protein
VAYHEAGHVVKWLAVFLAAAILALVAPTPTSAGGNLPQYQPFVGQWYRHGGPDLTVNADGTAVASWRTYNFCNDVGGVPTDPTRPCEGLDSTGYLAFGGVAKILLTSAEGSLANGTVQSSTDPAGFLKAGDQVQLALLTDGRMLINETFVCPPVHQNRTDPALGPFPCGV